MVCEDTWGHDKTGLRKRAKKSSDCRHSRVGGWVATTHPSNSAIASSRQRRRDKGAVTGQPAAKT